MEVHTVFLRVGTATSESIDCPSLAERCCVGIFYHFERSRCGSGQSFSCFFLALPGVAVAQDKHERDMQTIGVTIKTAKLAPAQRAEYRSSGRKVRNCTALASMVLPKWRLRSQRRSSLRHASSSFFVRKCTPTVRRDLLPKTKIAGRFFRRPPVVRETCTA
jgi:hypothetical protein